MPSYSIMWFSYATCPLPLHTLHITRSSFLATGWAELALAEMATGAAAEALIFSSLRSSSEKDGPGGRSARADAATASANDSGASGSGGSATAVLLLPPLLAAVLLARLLACAA